MFRTSHIDEITSISDSLKRIAKNNDVSALDDLDKKCKKSIRKVIKNEKYAKYITTDKKLQIKTNQNTRTKHAYAASIINATKELGMEGNLEAIYFLKKYLKIDMKVAIYGFASGRHIKIVNQLISEVSTREAFALSHCALRGYKAGGHLDDYKSLEMFTLTTDGILKDKIIQNYLEDMTNLLKNNLLTVEEFFQTHHELEKFIIQSYIKSKKSDTNNNENVIETKFDKITRMIKDKNRVGLLRFLEEGNNLIAVKGKYNSPITLLAENNDEEAINFLYKNFSTYIDESYLIRGWASKANTAEINKRLKTEKDYLNERAKGFAEGGHIELAEKTIELGASLVDLVYGYALAKLTNQVNAKLDTKNLSEKTKTEMLEIAAIGYAIAGDIENAEKTLAQLTDQTFKITCYARGGCKDQVDNILDSKLNDLRKINELLELAITGYIFSAHIDYAHQLCQKYIMSNSNLLSIAIGYANAYNFDEAEQFLELAKNDKLTLIKNEILSMHPDKGIFNEGITKSVDRLTANFNPADIPDFHTSIADIPKTFVDYIMVSVILSYVRTSSFSRLGKLTNQIQPEKLSFLGDRIILGLKMENRFAHENLVKLLASMNN